MLSRDVPSIVFTPVQTLVMSIGLVPRKTVLPSPGRKTLITEPVPEVLSDSFRISSLPDRAEKTIPRIQIAGLAVSSSIFIRIPLNVYI